MTPREMAVAWMRGKRRNSDRPAWAHPEDVVGVLVEVGLRWDTILSTAWLHDIIEDGVIEDRGLRSVTLGDLFDQDVDPLSVRDVWFLTHRKNESKEAYLTRLLACRSKLNWINARAVKVADRIANLRESASTMPSEWQEKYKAQAREFVLPLCEGGETGTAMAHLRRLLSQLV